jgi:hypothetical protein
MAQARLKACSATAAVAAVAKSIVAEGEARKTATAVTTEIKAVATDVPTGVYEGAGVETSEAVATKTLGVNKEKIASTTIEDTGVQTTEAGAVETSMINVEVVSSAGTE